MSDVDAALFERCLSAGGVAVFPADTVYGLACDPDSEEAVSRLYDLKRRDRDAPAAVMFFELELALAQLLELGPSTRAALERLLPGAVTLLLPNPAQQFPIACGDDPDTLGVRVPRLTEELHELAGVSRPVLQSSANHSGEPDPRSLEDVPEEILDGADLVLDGGELPGTRSTVLDLRRYEHEGTWQVMRLGAVEPAEIAAALG